MVIIQLHIGQILVAPHSVTVFLSILLTSGGKTDEFFSRHLSSDTNTQHQYARTAHMHACMHNYVEYWNMED